MTSRRIYITLNTEKEKDRVIEAYLSQSYNEADAIKDALYRLGANSTEKVQIVSKNNEETNIKIIPKWCNKVQNGAISTTNNNEQLEYNSTEKVQKGAELSENEMNQLNEFL
jgi:long-subunit acyl-CoA synthetase (AMP-forming)